MTFYLELWIHLVSIEDLYKILLFLLIEYSLPPHLCISHTVLLSWIQHMILILIMKSVCFRTYSFHGLNLLVLPLFVLFRVPDNLLARLFLSDLTWFEEGPTWWPPSRLNVSDFVIGMLVWLQVLDTWHCTLLLRGDTSWPQFRSVKSCCKPWNCTMISMSVSHKDKKWIFTWGLLIV